MTEQCNQDIDEIYEQPERNTRTPITEAASALWGACRFFVWVVMKTNAEKKSKEDYEKSFFEDYFGEYFDNPDIDGDLAVTKIGTIHKELDWDCEDGKAPFALLEVMDVIVQYAVQAMRAQKNDDYNLAWSYATDAQYWWGILNSEFNRRQEPSAMSLNAIKAVKAKLAKDPKQIAKSQVKECWVEWQNKPTNYRNKSKFAKDMMQKFEELDNQSVIVRWCSEWEKTALNKHDAY